MQFEEYLEAAQQMSDLIIKGLECEGNTESVVKFLNALANFTKDNINHLQQLKENEQVKLN